MLSHTSGLLTFKDLGKILCTIVPVFGAQLALATHVAEVHRKPIALMQPCVENVFRQNGFNITDSRAAPSQGYITGELSADKKLSATYEPGNIKLTTTIGALGAEYDAAVRAVDSGLRKCLLESASP